MPTVLDEIVIGGGQAGIAFCFRHIKGVGPEEKYVVRMLLSYL